MKFIKSFFKYYLPSSIIISVVGLFLFAYVILDHKPISMFILGHGKVHTNLVDAIVKEDEIELPNAKVFMLENGQKLLIYTPGSERSFSVIIVDTIKIDIGATNSGRDNYELVFGHYLFQSDNAYDAVYASSAKWDVDPRLVIADKRITYTTQRLKDQKYVDVNYEIILKGE